MMPAAEIIEARTDIRPRVAIILGSGLSRAADSVKPQAVFDFVQLPGFVPPTTGGHTGRLIVGTWNTAPVLIMAGRPHRYEGHSRKTVTDPIRVMRDLGVQTLVVSNAAGGLNPHYAVGDLVAIDGHLDFLGGRGVADINRFAFPSEHLSRMDRVYDDELRETAILAGHQNGFTMHCGTYLATPGPTYETRAEYRMMRLFGADLVGMSTVPEAVAAAACGMRVLAISMVSNLANPDSPVVASHEEVLTAGRTASSRLGSIINAVL